MASTPIWKSIAADVGEQIAQGHYAPGDKLPTEAALSARFGVNRHTVRRALSALAEDGIVHSRRGAGVFVAQSPTDYPIGRRVRFHQNVLSAGRIPAKEVLLAETRSASEIECKMLRLSEGSKVHAYEGLSLADGQPVSIFRSVFSAARFPDLLDQIKDGGSVTEALRQCGLPDYTRASTRLKAKLATPTQALHLRLREGAPLLHATSVNVDPDGDPVEFGNTWFAGDRITLTLGGD